MFKVKHKKTGKIYDVYAVDKVNKYIAPASSQTRNTSILIFEDGLWSWIDIDIVEPYVESVLLDTDEFVIIHVKTMIEDCQYEEFYVRKTMDDAQEFIDRYMDSNKSDDGEWIPTITNIDYTKELWTVVQLKAFLTIDEFEELKSTGQVGDYDY